MMARGSPVAAPDIRREARPRWARLLAYGVYAVGILPRGGWGRLVAVSVVLLLLLPTSRPIAAQLIRSDSEFSTFDTPHFRVTFEPGLEGLARRAGSIGEWAFALLAEEFLPPPGGPIEMVLADNVDFANATATVIPRNRIVAYVHPPAGDPELGFHDDWLELLILHELVHIFHLENAGGVWPRLRAVFGRNPALYPQFLTPGWLVEGLATQIESAHTPAGRVRGSSFDMMLRAAILEDSFFEIDRASIDPVVWPGGTTRYLYGALFIDHLTRAYGADAVSALVESVGRQLIPYRLERSARSAFGTSMSAAWEAWGDSLRLEYGAMAAAVRADGLTEPRQLTEAGREAAFPQFSPDGSSIAYMARTGRDEPSLRIISAEGDEVLVAPVTQLGPSAWSADGATMLYAELEYAGPFEVYSDLNLTSRGRDRRSLTRGERVWEPDLHPDGERAIVVTSAVGTNTLAIYDLATGVLRQLLDPDPATYWATPRWSPDGSRIAVGNWRDGHLDIVILDAAGELLVQVTSDRALDSGPTWSPDGRYLLFASDRTGISNLFAYDTLDGQLYRVTNVLTGAFQPDVSPQADRIAFSHYRADGYHIATVPFDPASWQLATPAVADETHPPRPAGTDPNGPVRPYSAWPSVLPTYWSPAVVSYRDLGIGLGFSTGGSDIVEKHEWVVELIGFPTATRLDGGLAYRYRGWGIPTLDFAVQQEWRVQLESADGTEGNARPALLRRDREMEALLTWRRPRFRSLGWLQMGADVRKIELSWSATADVNLPDLVRLPVDLGAVFGAGYTTVRGYAMSLGPQQGFQLSGRLEGRRRLETPTLDPANRNYWRVTSRGLAFRGFDWFGFAPSVLAARLDAGVEGTSSAIGFTAGGGGGGRLVGDPPLLRAGSSFPVRGYPTGTQGGSRVISGSLEYRFPIGLVERGYRLLPIAVDRLWGDLFLDAGTAWCPDRCAAPAERIPASPSPLLSVGAEVILGLRFGYYVDLPLRLGVALPLREVDGISPAVYLRTDRLF